MQIIDKNIDEIIPYANNPRHNDEAVDYVAASIKEFGFKVPVVIDKDNVIVAGHTRVKAAKKLGLASVPCVIADDLTPAQIKAFRLADNKVGEFATWDFEKLDLELTDLDSIQMTDFGFEPVQDETPDDDIEEVDVPENVEARCKLGDIWKMGGCIGSYVEIRRTPRLSIG